MIWNFPYNSPRAIIELLEEEDLAMHKKFGQNFLISPPAWDAIIESLGGIKGASVWEIGPGLGVLTHLLLKAGALVTAFEIDRGFARLLRTRAFPEERGFKLVEGDFLKTWPPIFQTEGPPDVICGNLPYNIGSVCIARLLEEQCLPERMSFTLQREVGERLTAQAGSKLYAPLSLLAQNDYEVEVLMLLKRGVFFPPPNVESTVVTFTKRAQPRIPVNERHFFFQMVKDLFAQRRKTVRNNLLKGEMGRLNGKEGVLQALRASGIAENERSENLSFDSLITLSRALNASRQ
ncbi:MAG: 16S rRNA (adenine(1518)-N(6)/adenine(1519)-N(6))-dimethyltransferase RsmA [Sphaerochaetaceae bacterium]